MTFQPLTFEQLLELWRRLMPPGFTVPLEEEQNGLGADVYRQQARQFARAAEAVAVTQQTYYKLPHSTQIRPPASGAQFAEGTVEIRRTGGVTPGAIQLAPGTLVSALVQSTRGNLLEIAEFALRDPVSVPAGTTDPVVARVRAVRPGWQGNVPAGSITAFSPVGSADVPNVTTDPSNLLTDDGSPDRFTAQMIGRFVVFQSGLNAGTTPRRIISASPLGQVTVDGPPLVNTTGQQVRVVEFAELGLTVSQPTALSGGRHAWLDAIGAERNVFRQDGETDDQFRQRICFLADTITPAAIEDLCDRILGPCGICCRVVENGADGEGFIYDLPVDLAPEIRSPWDDPDAPGNGVVWNSLATQNRYLTIFVSCGNAGENGLAYDASPFAPLNDNAWDWPGTPFPTESPPVWDGYPAGVNACISAFIDALLSRLAAGVGVAIIQDCGLDCGCLPTP